MTSRPVDSGTMTVFEALRLLSTRPDISQRELATELSLSLGKTHYVLHALLDKGLVKIQNFKRSGNKLAYAYMLTPRGVGEKLRLTRAFLARKEAEYEQLPITIAQLRQELELLAAHGEKSPHSEHKNASKRTPTGQTHAI